MADQLRNLGALRTVLLQVDVAGCVIGMRSAEHEHLSYTAYGLLPRVTRNGQLAFNGQLLECGVQGYLLGNGHRLYNPLLMRFNSPDSLSPFGRGGINTYTYCGGDPVNFSDPAGSNRFAKYSALFDPLFTYLASPDRKDYRLQGFAYDPAGAEGQRVTTVRAKTDHGKVLVRPVDTVELCGRFYVSKDRRLFISENLVLNNEIGMLSLKPFDTQFAARGFTLMDVNPTHVRIAKGKPVFDSKTITINESGMTDYSQRDLNLPGLADAIRKGRPGN